MIRDGMAECILGRIAVDTERRGPAEIMLRHEQIQL
eukprot:gene30951-35230_t